MQQLELAFMADLPPANKMDQLQYSFDSLHESFHRVRRSLWANDGKQTTMIKELSERLAILEKNICKD